MDPTKFVAKKSKAAAKKGVGNTQVRNRTAGLLAPLANICFVLHAGHPSYVLLHSCCGRAAASQS